MTEDQLTILVGVVVAALLLALLVLCVCYCCVCKRRGKVRSTMHNSPFDTH